MVVKNLYDLENKSDKRILSVRNGFARRYSDNG